MCLIIKSDQKQAIELVEKSEPLNLIISIMVKYLTHKEMRSRMRQIKLVDPSAKLLGLDIGRRWTGLAISDP